MSGVCKIISRMNIFPNNQRFYFGDITFPVGATLGPRIQEDLQLLIIHSGEVKLTVDDRSYRVGAREVTILHPRGSEFHLFSKKSRTHHSWCTAQRCVLTDDILKKMKQLPLTFPWTSRMEKIFHLGLEADRHYASHRNLVVDHLGKALFYELLAETVMGEGGENLAHPAVEQAMQFIANNLHLTLSSKDIAASAGISYQHLSRLFRNDLGSTPTQELWRIRTERGAELLRLTELSVCEIASQLGFQNPFHFSRCIKKRFKLTPIEMSRVHLELDPLNTPKTRNKRGN